MILGSFGFMFGTGDSARISKTIGEDKRKKPTLELYVMIAAGVTNMVLDALFVTAISQCVGGIISLFCFSHINQSLIILEKYVLISKHWEKFVSMGHQN